MKYSDAELARKAAAGYSGMPATPAPRVRESMLGQMRGAMKGLGGIPDEPMIKTIRRGHSPEDI